MKIGIMGGWNTDSGASFHTELVGRAWRALEHETRVFTFYKHAFHGTQITGEDEEYVERCFTVSGFSPPALDPRPFLTHSYEIFVVEDLGMLPKDLLGKIFHWIKTKAKTVNVIHDGELSDDPGFYQFPWDAIVCFDERYKNFLKAVYPEDKIHIIPYPCSPWLKGDKEKARQTLNLPQEKKIILSFGPASRFCYQLIPSLAALARAYPLLLLIVTRDKEIIGNFKKLKEKKVLEIEIREEAPDLKRLYEYLHASDALLYNKESVPRVVLSSTAFQCLGSGCPIIARASNYVELHGAEIMKYSSLEELEKALRSVFEKDASYTATLKAAEEYVKTNSALEVAQKFINLFKELLKK
jgi:hypothetical protein